MERIFSLVKDQPSGIYDTAVSAAYRDQFREELPSQWLDSVKSDERFTVDMFAVSNKTLNIIFPNKSFAPVSVATPMTTTPAALPVQTSQASFPMASDTDNAVGENTIPDPETPPTDPNFFDVYVSAAVSPSNFWIQPYLQVNNEQAPFKQFEMQMKSFYEVEGNRVALSGTDITRGFIAAANVNGMWRRVQVMDIIPSAQDGTESTECGVFSVDYGDRFAVNHSNMQPLHSQFRSLPRLAIKAELIGVKPLGVDWSPTAMTCFQELVLNEPFVSQVKAVKRIEQMTAVTLTLVDTSTDIDIYIHTTLIDSGYALSTESA